MNLPTTSVNCESLAYLATWRDTLDLRNFRMALANLSGPGIQASYTICLYHTSMGHGAWSIARSTFGALEVGGRCGQLAVVSYPSRVVRRPVAMVQGGPPRIDWRTAGPWLSRRGSRRVIMACCPLSRRRGEECRHLPSKGEHDVWSRICSWDDAGQDHQRGRWRASGC